MISCSVSPGHVRKCPLDMAFKKVDGLGLKRARWYHIASCSMFWAATILLTMGRGSSTLAIKALGWPPSNGMSHIRVVAFLSPSTAGAVAAFTVTAAAGYAASLLSVRTTMSPSSQSLPSDTKFVVNPGITWACRADSDIPFTGSSPSCLNIGLKAL